MVSVGLACRYQTLRRTAAVASPHGMYRRGQLIRSNDADVPRYHTFVEMYMARQITFHSDRLPAISAIAREIHDRTGLEYCAGLWAQDLLYGLTWEAWGTPHEGQHRAHPLYRPPSWSWASQEGPITYLRRYTDVNKRGEGIEWYRSDTQAHIKDVKVHAADNDIYGRQSGGCISISGPLIEMQNSVFRLKGLGEVGDSSLQSHHEHGSWKLYWDHSSADVQRDQQKRNRISLLLLYRLRSTAHGVGRARMEVEHSSRLNIILMLLPTGRGNQFSRVGLVEFYEPLTDDSRQSKAWQEKTVHII